ncbi:MAG: GNAT family N-acetyltransferase [Deefgea sp.]
MKKSITFRPATLEDAEGIAELIANSITALCELDHQGDANEIADWLSHTTTESMAEYIDEDAIQYIVLQGKKRLGFAAMNWQGEIQSFYIEPKHIGEGLGTALLAALELAAREQGLNHIMVATTHSARVFFRTHGFIPTRPDYAEWLEKPLQHH